MPRPGVRAAARLGHRQRLTASGFGTVVAAAAAGGVSLMSVSMRVLALLNSVVAGLAATRQGVDKVR